MENSFCNTLARVFAAVFFVFIFSQCSDEEISPEIVPITSGTERESEQEIAAPPAGPLSCSSCTYIVPKDAKTVNGKKLGIKPGDVICLNAASAYGLITFEEIVGTRDNPVIVTNCDGEVTINTPGKSFSIRFNESKYFRFTGGDVDDSYGIKLTGSKSNGLVLGYLTTNFEVDHIEVYKVGFAGIMAKTDPTCDDATIRGKFVMRDVSFHHNYLHDTHGEGFYIGHSSYNGKQTDCGMRLPHVIENVKVYKNIIRNSGWDGLQISSAPKGAEIYDNIIENYGTQKNASQNSGICIGGGTGGYCYNNLIKKGTGSGISVFGIANNTVYNNIIVEAGKYGIFADERTEPGSGYRFINNTIIEPKEQGMLLYTNEVPLNVVANNIIVKTKASKESHYVGRLGSSVKINMTNNYFTKNIADVKFLNASAFNFRLAAASPAIDKGVDMSQYRVTKDFYYVSRSNGSAFDIGATEY